MSVISSVWTPSSFMRGTFIWHAVAIGAVVIQPDVWMTSLSMILANQLLLTLAGIWPRSRILGPNWTHLPPAARAHGWVAITIDDGPDPDVTGRVLELLDQHRAKATFFCIGQHAADYPELCRAIIDGGHGLENHSLNHRLGFAFSGYWGFLRELSEAQQVLKVASGQSPRFFRAPFGIRNPLLDPVLSRLGLQLVSWTRRGFDTRETDVDVVVKRLTQGLAAGDILLLHDAHAARARDSGQPMILAALPRVLAAIDAAGLTCVTLQTAAEASATPGSQ